MQHDLVVRAQAGDEAAFASLADSSIDRLLAIAVNILGDAHLAEDATQQALLNMWRQLPRLRDPDRFDAWSYRLVVNACHSEVRHSRRWMPNVLRPLNVDPASADEIGVLLDRDQLEVAFRELSVDHRAVVVLHHYVGLPVADVATSLEIPEGTVRSRLYYAMKALRSVLRSPNASSAPVVADAGISEVHR